MINKDPNHKHIYDVQGKQLCCTQEQKIYTKANAKELLPKHYAGDGHDHDHEHSDDDGHDHSGGSESTIKLFLPAIISFILLLVALAFDNKWIAKPVFFKDWIRLAWYIAAYAPVGLPVMKEMLEAFTKREIFSEFTLMVIATVGAFAIGEYP